MNLPLSVCKDTYSYFLISATKIVIFGRKTAETVFFFTFPLVYARFFLFGDVFPEVKPYTNLLYYLFFAIDNIYS